MPGIDAYEKEEKLLSNRSKITRDIVFANLTNREQANAQFKQGITLTTEIDFVERPPKHPPRNVYLGRSQERWGGINQGSARGSRSAQEDEADVTRLKEKLAQQAEADKPLEDRPEEVQKRIHSTLGLPGVTFSKLPRFATESYPTSARPNSAGVHHHGKNSGTTLGDMFHGLIGANEGDNNGGDTGRLSTGRTTSARLPRKSEKELIREAEKENEIAEQHAAALHPTLFVKKETAERKKQVAEMCLRPTFGPPPPRPSSSSLSPGNSRFKNNNNQKDADDDFDESSSPDEKKKKKLDQQQPTSSTLPMPEGMKRASDFVLPWEVHRKEVKRIRVIDTAAVEDNNNNNPLLVSDEEDRDKTEREWQAERDRILDNFGLLGNRSMESAKKKSGVHPQPTTFVNMLKQVSRDNAWSCHAPTKESHDLLYLTNDDILRRHRNQADVRFDKVANRSYDVKPFYYVPDDLLKTDHLLKTHKSMVDRERNNFVRLLNDATEQELQLIAEETEKKKAAKKARREILAAAAGRKVDEMFGNKNGRNNNSNNKQKNNKNVVIIDGEDKKNDDDEDDDDGVDPIKRARAEAAKAFLRQFQPPDSVDVPGLPIAAADDARFNDGFTTSTRARPKTSGETIITRKFKGAPNLGSYADRPDDHFAAHFAGNYAAARKLAAKEVDAELQKAHNKSGFASSSAAFYKRRFSSY